MLLCPLRWVLTRIQRRLALGLQRPRVSRTTNVRACSVCYIRVSARPASTSGSTTPLRVYNLGSNLSTRHFKSRVWAGSRRNSGGKQAGRADRRGLNRSCSQDALAWLLAQGRQGVGSRSASALIRVLECGLSAAAHRHQSFDA